MKRLYQDWKSAHRNVRLLQTIACLRSVCQGIAIVDVSLYLNALGFGGGAVGGMIALTLLVRLSLSAFARTINARLGAKKYLLAFELLTAVASLTLVFSTNAAVICTSLAVAGLGVGHSGSGGPAGPIERFWIAAHAKQQTDRAYGFHAAFGYIGLAVGCLLAGVPQFLQIAQNGASTYRAMFAVITALSLACAAIVYRLKGGERKSRGAGTVAASTDDRTTGRSSSAAALVNGLALALSGTMTSYWLRAKFGVSEAEIGIVMALSYAGAGITSIGGIWAAERFGTAKAIVGMQLAGVVTVALMPWSGSIYSAAILTALTTSLHMGSRSNRSAAAASKRRSRTSPEVSSAEELDLSGTDIAEPANERSSRKRRFMQTRWRALLLRLSIVLWPGAFGRMIEHGHWVLPFYVAAVIQLATTVWYASASASASMSPTELEASATTSTMDDRNAYCFYHTQIKLPTTIGGCF
ncbi:hypothetical protein A8990_10746 [Paenibacillus taihuensis]|uniref:MFS transporter n=1 Tax=Paenibacillus taihuensis TaxID=1156355 RepID=A0A3D9S6Y9_9BACL|nr:MFS transporter [Paenibacillus taihuensis]REE88950.1 hypothetical protein A8990_10746 [Paenibacillus taihuensis]